MPPEKRNLRVIVRELVSHPFFPLLFIAELVKQLVEGGLVFEYAVLSAAALLLWVVSDSLDRLWLFVMVEIVGYDAPDDDNDGGE